MEHGETKQSNGRKEKRRREGRKEGRNLANCGELT